MTYRDAGKKVTDILYRYEADVHMFGSPIRRVLRPVGSNIPRPCNVRANYGIIRLMQSSFLASFRMSSTHNLAPGFRVRPETSSSRGGSRSLGEMETMQLLASGMTHSLKEFSISSDMRIVDVCRRCRCVTVICECDTEHTETDRMRISDKLLKFVICTYVAYKTKILLH